MPGVSIRRRMVLDVSTTIILMGADRTSIHRPDYCLPGQGWSIDQKTAVNIPIDGGHPYELPVMKWVIRNSFQRRTGRKQEVSGIYVFWFVADNEQTTDNVQLHVLSGRETFCAPGCCNAGLTFRIFPSVRRARKTRRLSAWKN